MLTRRLLCNISGPAPRRAVTGVTAVSASPWLHGACGQAGSHGRACSRRSLPDLHPSSSSGDLRPPHRRVRSPAGSAADAASPVRTPPGARTPLDAGQLSPLEEAPLPPENGFGGALPC